MDWEVVCVRVVEVFDDLGGEDDYLVGDGDGVVDVGYGFDVEVEGCGWGGYGGGVVGLVCLVVGVYGGCCKEEGWELKGVKIGWLMMMGGSGFKIVLMCFNVWIWSWLSFYKLMI